MLRGSLGEGRLDKAFGAEIKVALPESDRRQLFFVGSSSSGAELGLNEALALSLDPERFAAFGKVVGFRPSQKWSL
jgi:hypothetical protein